MDAAGEAKILRIRRLCCLNCGTIHVLPYKRYESACVEEVLSDTVATPAVAADDSTLYRWRGWFNEQVTYLLGCLTSIAIRFHQDPAKNSSTSSQSAHHRIEHLVGDAAGWLARTVRPVANANLWVQTVLHSCPNLAWVDSKSKSSKGRWRKE
ncbi:DUF6431 domain-containing protein [Paenibacillus sp. J2TS4]|uniref:DUF6431 domain-containing protein n=1 Tax=Paenibacillus sp. J2TS4 TaxID=2807194 RepID=UPI0020BE16FB|nr:DUF6431 domain-containing protein [Paenibacillus sp. J2TS4]